MDAKYLATAMVVSVCGVCCCAPFGKRPKADGATVTLSFQNPPVSGSAQLVLNRLSPSPVVHAASTAEVVPLGDFSTDTSFTAKLEKGIYEIGVEVADPQGQMAFSTESDDARCPTTIFEVTDDVEEANLTLSLCRAFAPPTHTVVAVGPLLSSRFSDSFLGAAWPEKTGETLALDLLPWFLNGESPSFVPQTSGTASEDSGAFQGKAFWSLQSRLSREDPAPRLTLLEADATDAPISNSDQALSLGRQEPFLIVARELMSSAAQDAVLAPLLEKASAVVIFGVSELWANQGPGSG